MEKYLVKAIIVMFFRVFQVGYLYGISLGTELLYYFIRFCVRASQIIVQRNYISSRARQKYFLYYYLQVPNRPPRS